MSHAMMHRMNQVDETGLKPIIPLTCANVKFVGRGSVERIVGGKAAPIEVGSACFSMAFAARLRRCF